MGWIALAQNSLHHLSDALVALKIRNKGFVGPEREHYEIVGKCSTDVWNKIYSILAEHYTVAGSFKYSVEKD